MTIDSFLRAFPFSLQHVESQFPDQGSNPSAPEVLTIGQPGKSLEHIYFRKVAIVYCFSLWRWKSSCYCCSVTKSLRPALCDPMDCSMPGFSVLHHLPEFSQIHVHSFDDAIQPSHSLLPPSSPALNLSQNEGLFQWVSSLHHVAKVLEHKLQHQSFQWIFRTDFP